MREEAELGPAVSHRYLVRAATLHSHSIGFSQRFLTETISCLHHIKICCQVKNYGPSTVDVLTVSLAWPHQVCNASSLHHDHNHPIASYHHHQDNGHLHYH